MTHNKTLLLVKYRGKFRTRCSIKSLLRQLGMPKSVWGVRNFWEHWHGQFDIILYDAKQLYKAHARRVHPRKDKDAEEDSKQLNSLWNEIQRRIKQREEPTLWITGKRTHIQQKPTTKAPPGFYQRTCAYEFCGRVFLTKNRRKKFCHRLHMHYHHTRAWFARNGGRRKPRKLLKCEYKHCGRLFWSFWRRKRFCRKYCCKRFHARSYYARNKKKVNAQTAAWKLKKKLAAQLISVTSTNSQQRPPVKGHPLPAQAVTENINVLAHH